MHSALLALLVVLPTTVEFVGASRSALIEPLHARNVLELVAPPRRAPKPPVPVSAVNTPPAPGRFRMPSQPVRPAVERPVIEARVPDVTLSLPRPDMPRPVRPEIPAPAPLVRTGLLVLEDVTERAPPEDPPRLAVRAGGFSDIALADDEAPRVRARRLDTFGAVGPAGEHVGPPRSAVVSEGEVFGPGTVAQRPGGVAAGVVNAGGSFGTARATTALGKPAEIRRSGFAQVRAAKADRPPKPKTPAPPITPIRILDKPRPEYSEQARRLRIEGNVLLEVLFKASGQVEVLRIVRGLGEGLDANALRAARQIRFEPARRDGKATDARARITIRFQLAY